MVDSGAVAIPVRWRGSGSDGRLGTRNACYLAFDCFHPLGPRHLWRYRSPRRSSTEVVRNLPTPTTSSDSRPIAVNLAPSQRPSDPGLPVGARQRRTGDCGDIGAAGADVVGRRRAAAEPKERTKTAASSTRDGRDSGADRPVSVMAKPPPDLATATRASKASQVHKCNNNDSDANPVAARRGA